MADRTDKICMKVVGEYRSSPNFPSNVYEVPDRLPGCDDDVGTVSFGEEDASVEATCTVQRACTTSSSFRIRNS